MTKPGHVEPAAAVALIGRHRELEAIDAALEGVAAGQGRAVVISGEAGIGKTRLADEAALRAAEEGFEVLRATSYPADTTVAYAAIIDAFGPHLAGLQPPERAKLTRGLEALGLLFEGLDLTSPPDLGDPALEKTRLFQATLLLIQRIATNRPVALVLDDLQWADRASIELASFLIRDLTTLPLLVVLTYRAEDLTDAPGVSSLLLTLRRAGAVRELELERLGRTEIHALGKAILNEDPPPTLSRLLERTGGTPLFVVALLEDLIDSGGLVRKGGRWFLTLEEPSVPTVVQDVFTSRLARLDETERRVIDALAVAGDAVGSGVLMSVVGVDQAAFSSALVRLVRQGLVVEGTSGGGVVFDTSHPLLREVAYREVPALQRTRIHAEFANVLEQAGSEDWAVLAFHYRHAGEPIDPKRRLEVLAEAGRKSLRRYANEEAAQNLRAALEALRYAGETSQLPVVLEDLGEAWQRLGEEQAAVRVWEEALDAQTAAGDKQAMARLYLRLALAESDLGRFGAAAERVRTGLGALPEGSPVEDRLGLLAVGVLNDFRRADPEAARAGLDEVARLAANTGSAPAQLRAHMLRVGSLLEDASYPEARIEALSALDLAREVEDRVSEQQALAFLALVDLSLGDLEALAEHLQANVELTARTGISAREYRIRFYRFAGAFYAGRWDDAADIAVEAELWAEQIDMPRNRVIVDAMPALLEIHRGQFDQAETRLRRARRYLDTRPGPGRPLTVATQLLSALAALEQGRPDQAMSLIDALEGYFLLPLLPPWGMMVSAEAQARLGDSRLKDTTSRLSALGPGRSLPSAWSLRVRGLAADRPEEAVELLTLAEEDFAALGMPFEAARARLEVCETLPEAEGVPERLDDCYQVFADLGASRYADRTARLLRSLGEPVPTSKKPATGRLTNRQIEVARLVAEGLSNAEIADRLYISPRTVTTHLEHIYQQLGFNSRALLVRYVVESELTGRETIPNI